MNKFNLEEFKTGKKALNGCGEKVSFATEFSHPIFPVKASNGEIYTEKGFYCKL